MVFRILLDTSTTSCWNGDCDGDRCSLGLCTDGEGLGVKNEPGGDKIPAREGHTDALESEINMKCLYLH